MELFEVPEVSKKCYKFDQVLFDHLNLSYNAGNSTIVLFNKYQIFVYDDLNFDNESKMIVPEFQIHQLIISNNYLLCLDRSGNIHTTSLKFKNAAQKRFKSSFQPKEQGVIIFRQLQDNILCLKSKFNSYFLCLHKINADFQLDSKFSLKYNGRWPLPHPVQDKCLLTTHKLREDELDYVIKLFEVKETVMLNDYSLVAISFDRLTVFACLINPKLSEDEVILKKLYACPSEICNMEIIKLDSLNLVIGLKVGSLVKLCLKNTSKKPEIVHLNTALYKFKTVNESIIYSDGRSMWRTENTFRPDIKFNQFFIRHVKDFIKFGDQLICTSFTNLIYIFSIDDESSYIRPKTTEEYCAAEKLLNNSEYLYKIMEEIEKNNTLAKKIKDEGNYITAFSLSKRQDIMDNIIQHSVMVYDNYEDALKENPDITLTENLQEYFRPQSTFLLVKLSASTLQHIFNNILSNIINDVKIHITFSTDRKLLKTTSIKVNEAFKKINALIPLDIKDETFSEISVDVKLISSIPGAFDERQKLWLVLYRKYSILNSEHFIKTTTNTQICLKEPEESMEDLIYKTALNHHGHLFKFTDISKHNTDITELSVYMKLPQNYSKFFSDDRIDCLERLNTRKIAFLKQSKIFLKCNGNISLESGNVKVKLEILNDDFTNPVLKVSSTNMAVAFHIRNLFSDIIYNDYKNDGPEKSFVRYTLYYTAENLQKEIKRCLLNNSDYEEFQPFAEQFERHVLGALPL